MNIQNEALVLKVCEREKTSAGSLREKRKEGFIPAVVYGASKASEMLFLEEKQFLLLFRKGLLASHVMNIQAQNGSNQKVILKDAQVDPVTDSVLHVDFLRVTGQSLVEMHVPIVFIHQELCQGIKAGGTLNAVAHEIPLMVSVDAIPDHIEVDVQELEMGETLHASDLKLPANTKLAVHGDDFVIGSIVAPTAEEEQEQAPETTEEDESSTPDDDAPEEDDETSSSS